MTTAIDWTVALRPEVVSTCETQARKVGEQYRGVVEADDLLQEAFIAVATNSDKVLAYLDAGDHGYFAHWVWSRLQDVARPMANRSNRIVPFDISEHEDGL